MPVTAALVVGGATLASGYLGAKAAGDAADTQAAAAREAAAIQKAMFDVQNAQQAPYRASGYGALNKINSMMGGQYQAYDQNGNAIGAAKNTTVPYQPVSTGNRLSDLAINTVGQAINADASSQPQTGELSNAESDYLTHQFNAQDFANGVDPGYAFRLKMGQDQAMRQANLGGGALSGNALAGLQDYTQGSASQEYGNAFNRYQTQRGNIYNTLASIAGLGQTSLGQTGTAGTAAGANIGQAISNAGSASAAGTVGAANALGGAIQGVGNQYYLNNLLKPQTSGANYSLNSGSANTSGANLTDMGGGQGIQLRT